MHSMGCLYSLMMVFSTKTSSSQCLNIIVFVIFNKVRLLNVRNILLIIYMIGCHGHEIHSPPLQNV